MAAEKYQLQNTGKNARKFYKTRRFSPFDRTSCEKKNKRKQKNQKKTKTSYSQKY